MTFGALRQLMMDDDERETIMSLGCSSNLKARHLADAEAVLAGNDSCGADASYCWHRCMPHADYNVSTSICAERQLRLACANEQGQKWPCEHDDSFYLDCIDPETADYPPGFENVDPADCEEPPPTASPAPSDSMTEIVTGAPSVGAATDPPTSGAVSLLATGFSSVPVMGLTAFAVSLM